MTEINLKDIDKYKKRKSFRTGGGSIAIILTGLIEMDCEYICWKDDNGVISLKNIKDIKNDK